MKHRRKAKLNVPSSSRNTILRVMILNFLTHGKMQTTDHKAKILKSYVEKFITQYRKCNTDLLKARFLLSRGHSFFVKKNLIDSTIQLLRESNGGYTRIIKLMNRVGDGAKVSLLQLVSE